MLRLKKVFILRSVRSVCCTQLFRPPMFCVYLIIAVVLSGGSDIQGR